MPSVACHLSQWDKSSCQHLRCFYNHPWKAAYHRGKWEGLTMVPWKKGEKSLGGYAIHGSF